MPAGAGTEGIEPANQVVIGEQAERMPAETKKLRERLENYLAAVDAQFPTVNPDYDPNRPTTPERRQRDQEKKAQKKPKK